MLLWEDYQVWVLLGLKNKGTEGVGKASELPDVRLTGCFVVFSSSTVPLRRLFVFAKVYQWINCFVGL